jgi:hypothetical protein
MGLVFGLRLSVARHFRAALNVLMIDRNYLDNSADPVSFDQAYVEYVNAVNSEAPNGQDRDALQIYEALRKIIHARAVTTEQISRKAGILMELQLFAENQSEAERLLLTAIKRDLDAMIDSERT